MGYYRLTLHEHQGPVDWITIAGDFVLPYFDQASASNGKLEKLYDPNLRDLIGQSAWALVNVEAAITSRGPDLVKAGPNIASPPSAAIAIRKAGFDSAILANNHILDRGPGGIEDTITFCNESGIETVGAGSCQEDAEKKITRTIAGRRIAVLAFTEEEFACATEHTAGAAKLDTLRAGALIKQALQDSDMVIVSAHGGREYCPVPSPRLRAWYRSLVDHGASAVIGHHQHVIEGAEIYKGAPIVYSIGHFFFDWRAHRPQCWFEGTVCRLALADGRICAVEIVGCEQVKNGTDAVNVLMSDAKQDWLKRRMLRLDEILLDDRLAGQFWQCFCLTKRAAYINLIQRTSLHIEYPLRQIFRSAWQQRNPGLIASWLLEKTWRTLQTRSSREASLLRLKDVLICPSHLELILTLMDMEIMPPQIPDEVKAEFNQLMQYCSF